MKFNLARCTKTLVFRSDPNFSIFFCAREVGHPAAKLMVLAVAIFMVACIKGFKNKALHGFPHVNGIGSELCHEVQGC